jgi:hypothetical protein
LPVSTQIWTVIGERLEEPQEFKWLLTPFPSKNGIAQAMAKKVTELAQQQGRFTIFTLVDALTRLTQEVHNAGDRTEAEQKVGRLLALAA